MSERKSDIAIIFTGISGLVNLDYVTYWFKKASDLCKAHRSNDKAVAAAYVFSDILDDEPAIVLLS